MEEKKYIELHTDMKPMIMRGKYGWMISGDESFLYKIDLENWTAEMVTLLCTSGERMRSYYLAAVTERYAICIPKNNKVIIMYDVIQNKTINIVMPDESKEYNITNCLDNNDEMFLFSSTDSELLRLDLEKCECTVFKKLAINDAVLYCFNYDTKMIFLCGNRSQYLYEYDVNKKTENKIMLNIQNINHYTQFCFDGKCYWLSGKDKAISIWDNNGFVRDINISTYDICEYDYEHYDIKYDEFQSSIFYTSIVCDNYVWFIPYETNYIFQINRVDFKVNVIDLCDEEESVASLREREVLDTYKYCFEGITFDGNVVIYSYKRKRHYYIDHDTGRLIDEKGAFKLINYREYADINLRAVLAEKKSFNLSDLLCFCE